jgi:hypothetical protein
VRIQPCPPWCTGTPGHYGRDLAELGTRSHERVLDRVVCSESTPCGCAVEVILAQLEVLEDDGRVERMPPGICVCGIRASTMRHLNLINTQMWLVGAAAPDWPGHPMQVAFDQVSAWTMGRASTGK